MWELELSNRLKDQSSFIREVKRKISDSPIREPSDEPSKGLTVVGSRVADRVDGTVALSRDQLIDEWRGSRWSLATIRANSPPYALTLTEWRCADDWLSRLTRWGVAARRSAPSPQPAPTLPSPSRRSTRNPLVPSFRVLFPSPYQHSPSFIADALCLFSFTLYPVFCLILWLLSRTLAFLRSVLRFEGFALYFLNGIASFKLKILKNKNWRGYEKNDPYQIFSFYKKANERFSIFNLVQ